MALKEDLKQDAKGFGKAFTVFGKGFLRSAKQVAGTAVKKVTDREITQQEGNVFKDGTWRETAHAFGKAFTGLGHTISETVTHKADAPAKNADSAEQAVQALNETVRETSALIDAALSEQTQALRQMEEDTPPTVQE